MKMLQDLPVGDSAPIKRVEGPRPFRRRLLEMGLTPGTPLRLVRRIPVSGLLELEVRGCRISLRETEARHVQLENES